MAGAGKTGMRRAPRRVHTPRMSYEELEIRTEDGVALRAVVHEAPEDVPFAGTCVLAHAMFARKSEFGSRESPGLSAAFAARGWRTIAFDFRGHGDSVLSPELADWGYDDLVRFDLPAVVASARARGEDKPVIVVGHSLGGHVALAAQGTGAIEADGILSIAGNVWLRELEPSRAHWVAKALVGRATTRAMKWLDTFPARALRLGSDDASNAYMRDLFQGALRGTWKSTDGRDDYLANLARITIPVCSVATTADYLTCRPACAEALVRRCRGPVEVIVVSKSDDGSRAPSHMGLVTSEGAREPLLRAMAWLEANKTRG